jgi:hypothetical protein
MNEFLRGRRSRISAQRWREAATLGSEAILNPITPKVLANAFGVMKRPPDTDPWLRITWQ